jgi:acetyl esterase/lipase
MMPARWFAPQDARIFLLMASLTRFLRAYRRPESQAVTETELTVDRGDAVSDATLFQPAGRGRHPGWVVLHGLTHTGRHHVALRRFVRAIAASGNAVLVPDIPEWRALHVAPAITVATIRAAVRTLHDREDIDPERVGLFGFSFGATQALVAATDPEVGPLLTAIAAWGGYCDLDRLFVYHMTGTHELDGTIRAISPDPYGAWVMVGNYLTAMPGHENDDATALALLELAREAGRAQIPAWDPVYNDPIRRVRATLAPDQRELFDMVAPVTGASRGDLDQARAMALELASAARRTDPLMDPTTFLPRVSVRTLLAHGRDDRLIPFTETTRLSRALRPETLAGCTITSLFAHSGGTERGLGPVGLARESARFVGVLRRILRLL